MSQPTPPEPQRFPADEPYESRDLELGAALRNWVEAQQGSLGLTLSGPLDSPGMDPTWILRITTASLEAEVTLFYGPCAEVAAFRPIAPDEGMYVGRDNNITADRLTKLTDALVAASRGAALPGWLRTM
jgi:hypothetical protein